MNIDCKFVDINLKTLIKTLIFLMNYHFNINVDLHGYAHLIMTVQLYIQYNLYKIEKKNAPESSGLLEPNLIKVQERACLTVLSSHFSLIFLFSVLSNVFF